MNKTRPRAQLGRHIESDRTPPEACTAGTEGPPLRAFCTDTATALGDSHRVREMDGATDQPAGWHTGRPPRLALNPSFGFDGRRQNDGQEKCHDVFLPGTGCR